METVHLNLDSIIPKKVPIKSPTKEDFAAAAEMQYSKDKDIFYRLEESYDIEEKSTCFDRIRLD